MDIGSFFVGRRAGLSCVCLTHDTVAEVFTTAVGPTAGAVRPA